MFNNSGLPLLGKQNSTIAVFYRNRDSDEKATILHGNKFHPKF